MDIDLMPLIAKIAERGIESSWKELAAGMQAGIERNSLVWPRFALWGLDLFVPVGLREAFDAEHWDECCSAIDQGRHLYHQLIAGTIPSNEEWISTITLLEELGEREGVEEFESAPLVIEVGFLAQSDRQTAGQYAAHLVDDFLFAAGQAASDAIRRVARWETVATNIQRKADEAREVAHRVNLTQQAQLLLLFLQLEQVPHDANEEYLQLGVIQKTTPVAIYCDYLEERGNPVAPWLRNFSPNLSFLEVNRPR